MQDHTSFVQNSRATLEIARSKMVGALCSYPEYESFSSQSNSVLRDIVARIPYFDNSILTVVGSFAMGMGTKENDFDGALFIGQPGIDFERAQRIENEIYDRLHSIGIESNATVITRGPNLWLATTEGKTKYYSTLLKLIAGKPIAKGYDDQIIANLIPQHEGTIEILTELLDRHKNYIETQSMEKYLQRLEYRRMRGKERW